MGDGDGNRGADGLNPSVWKDINEAVGDALGVSPPDPRADRVEGAPPHGSSPARMIQGTGYDPISQQKLEDNGVRFQMVPRATAGMTVTDLEREYRAKLLEQQEAENRRALARAWALFAQDGSLMGEYAPMAGQATTPDTVDAIWWLSLPRTQAMWELGLDKDDDATYSRVRRDIEAMAAAVINRMLQTRVVVPMVIRRKHRRHNHLLFVGGRLRRLKPVNPADYPGMGVSKRNKRPKPE
jgi:hypothetical protein